MRAIQILFGTLTLIILSVYIVLFTSVNKTVIVPLIEDNIADASKIKNVEITTFDLTLSSLKLQLLLENQTINVDSTFDLMAKNVDLKYDIKINDLSKFDYVSGQKLKGTFKTIGTLKGTFDNLKLSGLANVAKGDINYALNIDNKNINNIKATIKSIDLSTLMYMVNQPKFINGKFNSNIDISSLELDKIDFDANVQNGIFNVAVFKKELNLTIPKSDFKLDTDVNLVNKSGKFVFNFDSSLIQLLTNGSIDINSLNIDSKYKVSIDKLAMLEPVINTKLNGSFSTKGTIKGDKNSMKVSGFSDIANSKTSYNVTLKDLAPNKIDANIKNAKLDKILHLVNQPIYAKANLNLNIEINSLDKLNGKITTSLSKGLLNNKVIKNDFNISLPSKPTFDLKTFTSLNDNIIDTKSTLKTFAANIETKKSKFDTKTSIFTTDYLVTVPKLSKLYFITNQKMQGDIKINGDVKFKDDLTASFNSNKFNGKINGTLVKDILKLSIKDVNSLKLLNMMYYPEIYDSSINLDLDYNLTSKKGTSNLVMNNGKFLTNQLSQTIKKFIKKDLTKEIYEIAKIDTKINNQKLDSTLLMTSANSKISSKKMFIDLEKSTIDSKIDMEYFKYKIGLTLTDDLTSPKVKIDANKLLKSKAKTKVSEAIEKKLGDKLDDDTKKALGGFLNQLF
ncbi:MAG: hypothetical protein U9R39_06250 [Campylobacterota bacterium]|nr:hypothetical protein [Campylobacterota bacterium]